jgi:type I restriction enzyme S subunit
MPRTSWEKLSEYRLQASSLRDQRAIADYLDAETARIDALIEKRRRMIELLEEWSNSLMTRAVLGHDRRGVQRPSLSGFYGVVPELWAETSLRHLRCEVQTGPFGSQLHAEDYVEDGWPIVNPMNIVDGEITRVPTMTISESKRAELGRHILRDGDVVFGRRGEMGRAGLVGPEQVGWICGTGSLRLRLHGSPLAPSYLKLILETTPGKAYFQLASVGSTMDNLNSEILLDFPILVPPRDEQDQIVRQVATMRATRVLLTTNLEKQIELTAEYRQALITAAVTGQLDIPGVAA